MSLQQKFSIISPFSYIGKLACLTLSVMVLASCGGGSDSSSPPAPTPVVGGPPAPPTPAPPTPAPPTPTPAPPTPAPPTPAPPTPAPPTPAPPTPAPPTPAPPTPAPPTPTPTPTPPPAPPLTPGDMKLETPGEAAAFLSRATFGGSMAQIHDAIDKSASDLLQAEFNKPPTLYLPAMRSDFEAGNNIGDFRHRIAFWNASIDADDQLRQRMVFALSQTLVVSDEGDSKQHLTMAFYMDALSKNAFGNYRDLLKDITYTPIMAKYLTYMRNQKGDPETGNQPDENYAREFLQLFTTGLVELNMDGTHKLDTDGKSIELYDNEDIVGLARVFTGLSEKGPSFFNRNVDADARFSRLVMFDEQHSELEKTFLGKTIPAGTLGDASIDEAINHIFDHPNVAPFVSRQLIQRFTASHPSPAYVERVANAFETGSFMSADNVSFGTGERGDLKATLAAILLDEQFYDDVEPTPMQGKVREPVLRFIHWARAFNVGNVMAENERWLVTNADDVSRLGQQPFTAPSVFNFYRPGFIAPGTATGDQNLNAPEFQTINEGSVIGYDNFMLEFVFNSTPVASNEIDSFAPDYTEELALVEDPEALADHLNELLLNGRMSEQTKDRIILVLNEVPILENQAEQNKMTRVRLAIYMAVTSPTFALEL